MAVPYFSAVFSVTARLFGPPPVNTRALAAGLANAGLLSHRGRLGTKIYELGLGSKQAATQTHTL